MKFSIVAASLIAAVAAQYGEEVCSGAVTVTVTEYVCPPTNRSHPN
jgi:hypothetical protein